MKFIKLAKSDKFEYMMLSRLIQDAKYFIDYPDLKHLWAKTLDEHIKQMKEQYAKLDPKPEWISEEEINNLAKQMKESYTNHWNEVHPDNKIEAAIQQPNKPKPTTTLPDNLEWAWDPNAADWVAVMKDNKVTTPPLYDPNNQNLVNQNTTSYMSTVKSASCLAKFLDGPRYSKEIKIEAGLIKDGLVKYAGFDFHKGTKYTITDKGLEVLRKASEVEHNEAQNEREKLAYLFGFNTDKETILDTTGHYIKGAKKFTICEADGTELGEVEALDEIDAKVKFGIEHPEYADSQSIKAVCASEGKTFTVEYSYPVRTENAWYFGHVKVVADTEDEALRIAEEKLPDAIRFHITNKNWTNIDIITKDSPIKHHWTEWYYDGENVRNEYTDSKEVESQYEQTTDEVLSYPNPSETPHTDVILENHDGWVNTADKHFEYTEEQKRLLPLFKLTNDLITKKKIIDNTEITPDIDDTKEMLVTGNAEVINDLEHKVKDLGFYCEPIIQADTEEGLVYSLKIFLN